jgi:prepilin-type N-terminal cleavage/methylation domain-containing protein
MHRDSQMVNQKGFSLIETLVGIALMGIIGLAILTALTMASRSNITNNNLTRAESLARTQVEYVQDQPYHATNNGTIYPEPAYTAISLPPGYSFAVPTNNLVTRVAANGNTVTTDTGLQKITISIRYGGTTIYTVSDFKVNR